MSSFITVTPLLGDHDKIVVLNLDAIQMVTPSSAYDCASTITLRGGQKLMVVGTVDDIVDILFDTGIADIAHIIPHTEGGDNVGSLDS